MKASITFYPNTTKRNRRSSKVPYPGTNRLRQVRDSVHAANYTEDIDDQSEADNYVYDDIGNLVEDKAEGIDEIQWNVYGKIREIIKANGDTIRYTYDATGNRISKNVIHEGVSSITWYARDATGNVMSVYNIKNDTARQEEIHLYGSSRLGIVKPIRILNLDVQSGDTSGILSLLGGWRGRVFRRGQKFFELSNHLGNVLVTISDKKSGIDANTDGTVEYYLADVASANDYYPGGMLMPGRSLNSDSYRYSINGQEKTPEIAPNTTTAEFWQYDARIVRRWNVDPRPNIAISPYNCFAGNPVWSADYRGDTIVVNANIPTSTNANAYEQYKWYTSSQGQGFHDANGNYADLSALVKVSSKNQFLKDVNAALATLYLSKPGKDIIDKITNLPETRIDLSTTINQTNSGGGLIAWNPNLNTGGIDEKGSEKRPAFIGLGHELKHEFNNLTGASKLATQTWATKDDNGNPLPNNVNDDEISVTHFENQIRAAFGYPLRSHYAYDQNKRAVETTRLIKRKSREALYVDQNENLYYSKMPAGIIPYKY